ncbi:MAG: DEAD/DEAH box helicase, partial [Desulfotomaculales bacterium]
MYNWVGMAWRSEDLENLVLCAVPARIYRRGEDYLARGRVLEWWQEGDALVGRVQGSYGYVYQTRVWLLDHGLEATCTCPYGDFCKHAVALVLAAAREQGGTAPARADFEVDAGAAGPPERPEPAGPSHPRPPALPEPARAESPGRLPDTPASPTAPAFPPRFAQKNVAPSPVPLWEELLSLALDRPRRPEPERGLKYLVYRLYPHERGLGLTVGVARYGVRGLGTETPFHFDPWYPCSTKLPPGATELDRLVLRLVQRQGYPAENCIPAPLVDAALDLFFRLPFVFWGSALEPIAPGGSPLLARLTVEEAGGLRLRAVLYGADGREWTPPASAAYLLANRLWVIYQDRFFREVVAPCAPELIFAALVEPPTIPAGEAERFVARYLLPLRAAGVLVPPPSLAARIQTGTPRPVLALWEEKRALVGRLAFSYGEGSLPVGPAGTEDPPPLEVTREDGTHWIYREVTAEEAALQRLADLGAPVGPDGAFVLTGEEALDFLWRLEEVAVEWEVYGLEKLRHYRLCRVRPRTRVRVSSGLDWFELELDLEWDGGRAGTEVVLPALRSGHRYVRLQDGRYVPLPPEWREAGAELVADMETHEVAGGRIRLPRAQAPLAAAWLDTAAVREEDEGWRQFLHRLRHFGGVGAAPLPGGLKADLRPYQRHGYDWLCFLRDHGLHGVLADEMGLGKTVQVLALLLAEKEGGCAAAPSLVVVPTSLVWNWVDEARRFTPDLRVLALVGQQRHRLFEHLREYDLAVTTYGLLVRDGERLAGIDWHYLVLDEAHRIKNPATQAARAACR